MATILQLHKNGTPTPIEPRVINGRGWTRSTRFPRCIHKLLQTPCSNPATSSHSCFTFPVYPPAWDHGEMWIKDGKPVALTSQPYDAELNANLREMIAFADRYGLDFEIRADGWYSPDVCPLVICTVADGADMTKAGRKMLAVRDVLDACPGERCPKAELTYRLKGFAKVAAVNQALDTLHAQGLMEFEPKVNRWGPNVLLQQRREIESPIRNGRRYSQPASDDSPSIADLERQVDRFGGKPIATTISRMLRWEHMGANLGARQKIVVPLDLPCIVSPF